VLLLQPLSRLSRFASCDSRFSLNFAFGFICAEGCAFSSPISFCFFSAPKAALVFLNLCGSPRARRWALELRADERSFAGFMGCLARPLRARRYAALVERAADLGGRLSFAIFRRLGGFFS
jgi:hypothetical protein